MMVDDAMMHGHRIMDLACGTGLVGIGCALLGAKEVVLTDIFEFDLIRENVRANITNDDIFKRVRVEEYWWYIL
jgi:predicted RNA methylase